MAQNRVFQMNAWTSWLWIFVVVFCLAVGLAQPMPADAMARPARPKTFDSPDDLRTYLNQLGQYYAVAGRPRCDNWNQLTYKLLFSLANSAIIVAERCYNSGARETVQAETSNLVIELRKLIEEKLYRFLVGIYHLNAIHDIKKSTCCLREKTHVHRRVLHLKEHGKSLSKLSTSLDLEYVFFPTFPNKLDHPLEEAIHLVLLSPDPSTISDQFSPSNT